MYNMLMKGNRTDTWQNAEFGSDNLYTISWLCKMAGRLCLFGDGALYISLMAARIQRATYCTTKPFTHGCFFFLEEMEINTQ